MSRRKKTCWKTSDRASRRPAREALREIEANVIPEPCIDPALTLGVGMFEALAERHHVRQLLIVGGLVDGKLPDGRPISLVYDPADGHTVSDYIALARTLQDLVGYPVCLLNRERIFEQASEEWEKHLILASYWTYVTVSRESSNENNQRRRCPEVEANRSASLYHIRQLSRQDRACNL